MRGPMKEKGRMMTILEVLNRVLEILIHEHYAMNAETLAQAIKQLQNGEPVTNKLVEK